MQISKRCSVKSTRKRKGEGHLRRAEILETAQRIFVRDGYQAATIRRIAEEVGVSSTALYMYFRDKDEMLLEICESAFADLMARNQAIMATSGDGAVRVRLMLEAYLDFALANPNAYALAFDRPATELAARQDKAAAADLGRRCYALYESALTELGQAGRLRSSSEVTAQVLWASVHGLASLLITKSGFPWADPVAVRTLLLDGLFEGLVRP